MTTYGTIPPSSSSPPSSTSEYITRAKHNLSSNLSTLRPWRETFSPHSFSLPKATSEATQRVKSNLSYFQMNYTLALLLVIFLSLIWHPFSMIAFIVIMLAWLFFYFLRDEPLRVFNKTVGDKTVMVVLGIITIGGLLLTNAVWNVVWSLLVGGVLVLVHAVLRKMEYLELDEEARVLPPSS